MVEFISSTMSLIYTRNSRGPRIEPCGTPEHIGRTSEYVPESTTR
jgi:hypothetical protein